MEHVLSIHSAVTKLVNIYYFDNWSMG